jgi:hypothetical protein
VDGMMKNETNARSRRMMGAPHVDRTAAAA